MILLTFAGCSSQTQGTDSIASGKLKVMTTLFPYYDFVRQIAGDRVELTLLVPSGKDTHSFEPTPSDMISIQKSDLFIYNGGELETWVDKILSSIDTDNVTTVSMLDSIDLLEEELAEGMEEEDAHDDGEETEYDEHIWTSPKNAVKLIHVITETLAEADPDNSSVYRTNAENYIRQLNELDADFTDTVTTASRKIIVLGDKFPLLYFTNDYDLDYRAAFSGCSTDTEPSVETLAYLINLVKEQDIPVVYYLELSSHSIADAISEATGAKSLLFHSCHNISTEDFESGVTYMQLMKQNVENLKEGLN